MNNTNATWVIVFSLLISLLIYALPMPADWRWYRPELPALVAFYWTLALPHRMGLLSAAAVGFAIDLLNGSAFGAMGAGMVGSTLLILMNYQRIRQFDAVQQSVTIGLMAAFALVVERWAQNLVGISAPGMDFMYSLPLTAALWIPLRDSLRSLRRYYEVS